jgi:uncharacterized phage-associated protein
LPKATAKQVADWIIAFHHEHGDPITNLRLQKLLYYAQAWRLALADEPLFDEDFEAWIHGPVVPAVYREFKKHGCEAVPVPPVPPTAGDEPRFPKPGLGAAVEKHLGEVLEAYGDLSTWSLEQLTHQEEPWREARVGLEPDAPCQRVIRKETMTRFYKSLLKAVPANGS